MQPVDSHFDRQDEPDPGSKPSPPVRPENRYEESDASFKWVLIVAIASTAIGVAIFLLVRGFYHLALETRSDGQTAATAPPETPTQQLPPEPRLELLDRIEKTPASNVAKWEQGEESALEKYGRTDEKGFVRIPLERAMGLLAGRLPARKESDRPKFKDRGLVDAGESNSGRLFRGTPK